MDFIWWTFYFVFFLFFLVGLFVLGRWFITILLSSTRFHDFIIKILLSSQSFGHFILFSQHILFILFNVVRKMGIITFDLKDGASVDQFLQAAYLDMI